MKQKQQITAREKTKLGMKTKNILKQTAASNRTAVSGGSHSVKNGFAAYCANVKATIAYKC